MIHILRDDETKQARLEQLAAGVEEHVANVCVGWCGAREESVLYFMNAEHAAVVGLTGGPKVLTSDNYVCEACRDAVLAALAALPSAITKASLPTSEFRYNHLIAVLLLFVAEFKVPPDGLFNLAAIAPNIEARRSLMKKVSRFNGDPFDPNDSYELASARKLARFFSQTFWNQ